MEARGEKNVSSGRSKEIAGLKKMKMMKMMTPGRIARFACVGILA